MNKKIWYSNNTFCEINKFSISWWKIDELKNKFSFRKNGPTSISISIFNKKITNLFWGNKHNSFHRIDGPAHIKDNLYKEYCLESEFYFEEEYWNV